MAKGFVITFAIFALSASQVLAQSLSWSENDKYWSYRNRLVNKFVVRGANNNACNNPSGLSIPAKLAFTYESNIRWADGGAQLGWYIVC
jgi:hypothetical protein